MSTPSWRLDLTFLLGWATVAVSWVSWSSWSSDKLWVGAEDGPGRAVAGSFSAGGAGAGRAAAAVAAWKMDRNE